LGKDHESRSSGNDSHKSPTRHETQIPRIPLFEVLSKHKHLVEF